MEKEPSKNKTSEKVEELAAISPNDSDPAAAPSAESSTPNNAGNDTSISAPEVGQQRRNRKNDNKKIKCSQCSNPASKRCASCQRAPFCSLHWKPHKLVCSLPPGHHYLYAASSSDDESIEGAEESTDLSNISGNPAMASTRRIDQLQSTTKNDEDDMHTGGMELSSLLGAPTRPGPQWDGETLGSNKNATAGAGAGAEQPAEHICANCNQPGSKQCGKCKKIYYCSRECQVEHWKTTHKRTCKLPLKKIMLRDLELGVVHTRRYVELTIATDPVKVSGITFVAVDENGNQMMIAVYGFPDWKPMTNSKGKESLSLPTGVKNTLANGQRLRIYDPWFKPSLDGQHVIIRVDNYKTIEFIN